MELLPNSAATRPRLACEVRTGGVLAARSDGAAAGLAAVSRAALPPGTLVPSLRGGNVAQPEALAQGIRQALDGVATARGDRSRYATLLLPTAAVRVLLIDFDALPSKAAEALPVVRFRMRKLLPFDVDHAVVSYQQMPAANGTVSVLAVAIPRDVLAEYEAAMQRAGYLPGAVLPGTLATLAGLEDPAPALIVHTDAQTVTTMIVRGGSLLLHRTVEVNGEDGWGEVQARDRGWETRAGSGWRELAEEDDPLGYGRLEALAAMQVDRLSGREEIELTEASERAVSSLNQAPPVSRLREIAQAVSVAAAYFEDTLRLPASEVLSAGTVSAAELRELLREHGMEELQVKEMVSDAATAAVATAEAPGRGLLAGVRGALRG